jgi:uncharacterized membrane protein YcaP (DUF421 family)
MVAELAAAAMLLLGGMLLTRLAGRRSVSRSHITG